MTRILALTLLLATSAHAVGQVRDEAHHVHFLFAVDTVTPDSFALGLDLDRDHLAHLLRDALKQQGLAEGPQGRYTVTIFDGKKMQEKFILDYYRTLKPGPNDTLVYYFSGHGGFYPEKGHLLAMRNWYSGGGSDLRPKKSVIDRKELLAAMGRHPVRATIVLTDCCSSTELPLLQAGAPGNPPDPSRRPKLTGEGQGELLRDLFFRTRGVVNITAARTGTPARGDRNKGGSFFTLAMWKLLKEKPGAFDANRDGIVEWREFYPHLSHLTELESLINVKARNGTVHADFHTPEAFMLGEPVRPANGIQLGQARNPHLAVDDRLTEKDPSYLKSNSVHYIKNYRVPMKKGHGYLVSLHSSHFDTFLFVKDLQGKTLAFNDDYGTTTTRSRVLFYPPQDGEYLVGVSSFGAKETGAFSLTVHQSTFVDQLNASDPKDRFCLGAYTRIHPVHLTALRSYTIQLESNDFDTYLRVEDEFGNTIALNDDEDSSQERNNSIVSLRTVSTGTYYIVATSFLPAKTGRYGVFIQD